MRQDAHPILWTDAEPSRLERDRDEIAQFAPELEFCRPEEGSAFPHGAWRGHLPLWPFDRPEPPLLKTLIGRQGLGVEVIYGAAYPMIPPRIVPKEPTPTLHQRTQTAWHVAPDGSLCLLQTDGAWRPEDSITELLAKAAGWRVEYALMLEGVMDVMTVNGIALDHAHDHLIAQAVDAKILESQDQESSG